MDKNTKKEYRKAKANILLINASSSANLSNDYSASKRNNKAAIKALKIKMKEEKREYSKAQKALRRKNKAELRKNKIAFKKGLPEPEKVEESDKIAYSPETQSKEKTLEDNKKVNDYTTCLSGDQAAYLRQVNKLPRYTRGEEIFNEVTHIVGGGFGVIFLVVGIIFGWFYKQVPGAVTMAVFGFCTIFLYTMSAIYHGLHINKAKKVFQIIDHCTIYVLISGSYTPICVLMLQSVFPYNYVLLGAIYLLAALGISLNGTMMDKLPVKIVSNTLYIVMGWACIIFYQALFADLGPIGFWLFLGGGICYTVGAIFYGIGHNVKYFHSIFHMFVMLGTLLQFLAILLYGIIGL